MRPELGEKEPTVSVGGKKAPSGDVCVFQKGKYRQKMLFAALPAL